MVNSNTSLLSLSELCNAVSGVLEYNGLLDSFSFTSVVIDSRSVVEGSLFIPLVGEFEDGHKYIQNAVENGAVCVFTTIDSWKEYEKIYTHLIEQGIAIIKVQNTLRALQDAAAAYIRKFPKLIKIGITGSNGKTTTKELIGSIIKQKYNTIITKGNLNSETGLPLSVFTVRSCHQVCVFEMGMNRVNEIQELANVLFPDYAVITNIGTAHIGILGSKQAIAEEKKKIFSNFSNSCYGFVPEDDEYKEFLISGSNGHISTFGFVSQPEIKEIELKGLEGTSFTYKGEKINFQLPGKYNLKNAMAAIAITEKIGVEPDLIKKGLEAVTPMFGRSNVFNGSFTVVEDCYNANAESMLQALDFYSSIEIKGKRIFILGDMLELGASSKKIHEAIGQEVIKNGVDVVYFIGSEMENGYTIALKEKEAQGLSITLHSLKNTDNTSIEQLAIDICSTVKDGDLLLVKGSRGLKLERITEILRKKQVNK